MTENQFEDFVNKEVHEILDLAYYEVDGFRIDVYLDEFKEEKDIQAILDNEFGKDSVKVTYFGASTLYVPHSSNNRTHIWKNDGFINEEDINMFLKTAMSDERFECVDSGIRCLRENMECEGLEIERLLELKSELAILERMQQEGAEYYHLDIFGNYTPYDDVPDKFEDADDNRIMTVYGFELEYVEEEETRAMLPTTL